MGQLKAMCKMACQGTSPSGAGVSTCKGAYVPRRPHACPSTPACHAAWRSMQACACPHLLGRWLAAFALAHRACRCPAATPGVHAGRRGAHRSQGRTRWVGVDLPGRLLKESTTALQAKPTPFRCAPYPAVLPCPCVLWREGHASRLVFAPGIWASSCDLGRQRFSLPRIGTRSQRYCQPIRRQHIALNPAVVEKACLVDPAMESPEMLIASHRVPDEALKQQLYKQLKGTGVLDGLKVRAGGSLVCRPGLHRCPCA